MFTYKFVFALWNTKTSKTFQHLGLRIKRRRVRKSQSVLYIFVAYDLVIDHDFREQQPDQQRQAR